MKYAQLIEQEALKAGDWTIDGFAIKGFEIGLLTVGDGSVLEHLDIHSGAELFYRLLLEDARMNLGLVKEKHDNWYAKAYQKVKVDLESLSGKKPTIGDIEHAVKLRYAKAYKKICDSVREREHEFNVLSIWCRSWSEKGFSMKASLRSSGVDLSGAPIDPRGVVDRASDH